MRLFDRTDRDDGAACIVMRVERWEDGQPGYWISFPDGRFAPVRAEKLTLIRRTTPPLRLGDLVKVVDPHYVARGAIGRVTQIAKSPGGDDYWIDLTHGQDGPFPEDYLRLVRRAKPHAQQETP